MHLSYDRNSSSRPGILDFMKNHILILDGAMGTLLQAAGLQSGEAPETWNLSHPDVIRSIHSEYFCAGSHVVSANTFGANSLHFDDDTLQVIIEKGLQLAKEAAAETPADHPRYVALDVGPTGKLLKPYGDLGFEEAVDIFAKTIRFGAKAGADLIFIETMNDSYETKAALLAAKENCDLPVFVSNAYGSDGKLMTGASPEAMTALLEGMGADAVGTNCSYGPEALRPVVARYLSSASVPVLLKPNAGLPHVENGKTVYDVSPEEFADSVAEMVRQGVRICGGCCGTTPEYIRALSQKILPLDPLPVEPKSATVIASYTHALAFGSSPLLIGERINPTGKKRFKQALSEHDIGYVLREGIAQQDAGAHILDVNVGMPGIDEPSLLAEVVAELQAVLDLPLQIDTSNPQAMARALRIVNGKPLINSVNGTQESMEAIFPLAKKYGGVLICLTLDEKGIPETAEGRVRIAERILTQAASYGIPRKDLIFDPLAMTVSSSSEAALVTLEALRRIREDLHCHTSLGISNVSFGLPARDGINSTYFALALENGLSCAIMNPHSYEMMRTYHAFRALHGLDDHCMDYINYVEQHTPTVVSSAPSTIHPELPISGSTLLQSAVEKGLKEEASRLALESLQSHSPLEVISNEIVPALNRVGVRFEQKSLFLPQLLMSAEAAAGALDIVKTSMQGKRADRDRSRFVLATVKGDIHDIGKNIVRLLLESYGFLVTDLGKDTPPETILEAVVRLHAPMCGLSALMTTTVPAMEQTIALLHEKAPWCRVIVGGAVLTQDYADRIGADAYAQDAMACVRIAEEIEAQTSGKDPS
ncbi:MAG: homocysteine S-methyltransferase family protein [Clostridiales bacterium]|nr:homocysteine S-methyltransferase family protein [Clostridiales bacterium]